ncbi:hypothetical protein [Winogradskyella poriferorum]|uniref:hypothetical protein n=1 Tax=Winogradskyella poriferorum TaxID=307627 RepID=UPI003D648AC1
MPYRFDWNKESALVTFHGEVTYADIESADEALFNDPRFDNLDFIVYDLLTIDDLDVTDHNLQVTSAINSSASQWNRKLKMAFVAKDGYVLEAVERFIELMQKSNWKIRVFGSLKDAFKWA